MQEPEFEKKVRVKMDELKFSPSDAVWVNVQSQIRKDRERRRPIFWFFISGACLLLGLAVFEMLPNKARNKEHESKVQETRNKVQESKAQEIRNKVQEGKVQDTRNKAQENKSHEKSAGTETDQLMDEVVRNDNNEVAESKASDKVQDARLEASIDAIAEAHLSTNASNEPNAVSAETDKNARNSIAASPTPDPVNESGKPSLSPNPAPTALASDKSVQTHQAGSKHPWKFGFLIAPGISNYQSGQIFHQSSNALTYSPAYLAVVNPTPVGSPAYYQLNTSTHSGFSFLAGASLQKYLSQNVYFSTGLNYHYYSTATSFSVGSTLLSSGNTGANVTYSDAFHFIELPAGLGFHLSHNKKSPLIAELGFSLSQLIQENAHQYDGYTGYYTVSSSAFSHTQVFANLGMLLSLPVKKNQLTIGPVLQYGLTNLLSSGSGNPEHLFFLGFRFGISLNK